MKTIKIKTSGKSLFELHKEFGIGSSGFYSSDPRLKKEAFAIEKPPKGLYEIIVSNDLHNKTYQEQVDSLPTGFEVLHPATVVEIILTHYKETGERIFEDWYGRTSSLVSHGNRVYVGSFDGEGVVVNGWGGDFADLSIGLSVGRKLPLKSGKLEPIESLTLESRVTAIEKWIEGVRNQLL